MTDDTLRALQEAEERYLTERGWRRWRSDGPLWVDPWEPTRTHIARVAANKQRQRDANAENQR